MAKHPVGKYLRLQLNHNGNELLIYVVKGSRIEDMPPDEDEDYPGEMHLAMPKMNRELDSELARLLGEASGGDVIVIICAADSVFEHGFSQVRALRK